MLSDSAYNATLFRILIQYIAVQHIKQLGARSHYLTAAVLLTWSLCASAELAPEAGAALPTYGMPAGEPLAADNAPPSAYPEAYLRPKDTADARTGPTADSATYRADASTVAAASAFGRLPAEDADSLVARLKAMEELATLWGNDTARIFLGLDDQGHPGIHLSNAEQR